MNSARPDILILGIGNLLWADEGFGVRCVERLSSRFELPDGVRAVDGGTQGLYLLPLVQDAEKLIVFDAVDYGLPPGTLKVVEDAEVPRFMGAKKMSLHQTGFQEVIAAAELTGRCPASMMLIGVQAEQLEDFGGSLRPIVAACLDPAIELAIERLHAWGIEVRPRAAQADSDETAPTRMDLYERGRPSAELACRVGDPRVLGGGRR